MYFVDFLGKVLLPLFYSPIFFTIAYENFFKGGVNRIQSDYDKRVSQGASRSAKNNNYTFTSLKEISKQQSTQAKPPISKPRINLRLFLSGMFFLCIGLALIYMTYINLIKFIQ
jgi:hypothetical protein